MRDMVVLVNLDDSTSRAVARKLRSEHVYCKILPPQSTAEDVLGQEMLGILLAGGSTGEAAFVPHLEELMDTGLPMLAMGDAALTLCTALGGSLGVKAEESGTVQVHYAGDDTLFDGVEDGERYLPNGRWLTLPEDGTLLPLAQTDEGVLGFKVKERPLYGMAFQAEQNDPDGLQLLINFCKGICGCTLWWSNQTFVERAREEIERAANGQEAICALSGGVDSAVCAVLGNMALGHRLHCVFVDTGLFRRGESKRVMTMFRDTLGLKLTCIDAQEEFLQALRGVTDPTEKETIIFSLLRDIIEREAERLPNVHVLIRGTNYTDTLNASAGFRPTANSRLRVIEPVRELFKDEIRAVAEEIGLATSVISRQPFPGTGLASRILGVVNEESLSILREADAIFREEVEAAGQRRRMWQYFAVLAENLVPGMAGRIVVLRAVQVADGKAAVASRLPYDLLERASALILERLPSVHRVLYDLTPSNHYAREAWDK